MIVIFIGQIGENGIGLIVYKYDIKCFERDTDEAANCKLGTLNPFYAETHYIELNTATYWE